MRSLSVVYHCPILEKNNHVCSLPARGPLTKGQRSAGTRDRMEGMVGVRDVVAAKLLS